MTRGRKPKTGTCQEVQFKLYLWEGEDDDIIAFLEGLPERKRAAGIKLALRSGSALSNLHSADLDDEDDDLDFDLNDFIS
ncbi:MAG: hypothetical protein HN855_06305 [Anaerolineae bacterium]|jgi:hypothetical protein|nr:hypothetical protein [Anaerolineae bacterium]MBT7324749.1 hypothetical protein [Anaerolineae bacterium]